MDFKDGDQGPVGFPGGAVAERGSEALGNQKISEGDVLVLDGGSDVADPHIVFLFCRDPRCRGREKGNEKKKTGGRPEQKSWRHDFPPNLI